MILFVQNKKNKVFMNNLINYMYEIANFFTKAYKKWPEPFYFISLVLSFIVIYKALSFLFNRNSKIRKFRRTRNLNNFSWQEFEEFTVQYFKKQGFSVKAEGGSRADGGIDAIIKKGKTKKIVQVKRYKGKVSVSIVREMLGVYKSEKKDLGLTGVVIVTSSSFSKPAIEFALKNNVELVDAKNIGKVLGI